MIRRLAEGTLSACVVLLMFGGASVADDEFFFDWTNSAAEESADAEAIIEADADDGELADLFGVTPVANQVLLEPDAVEPEVVEPLIEEPIIENPPVDLPVRQGIFGWKRPAPHYDLPSRSFSSFRSPVSYGWGYWERCVPRPWRPRGDGIPERSSCYRMDYRPYMLEHNQSKHGPAFYQRFELYPCEECHKHKKHLVEYYGHRY